MILVLNSGGNVGSALVKELRLRGAEFTAAFRSVEDVRAAEAAGMRAVVADMEAPDTLRSAMASADHVFVVGPPSPKLQAMEANVVDAATAAGVDHLVKLSVWGAEEGRFIFSKPHQASERRIIGSGLPYTFLRPTGFMQNMLANAATIKSQGAFYMPAGEARVAEIDVRDIARVAAAALTEPGHVGKAYDLTGP
ncbi:MAG TPA: NAD(P)H-binding protein, partial [Chthonomonadaceae bacterium]|nr:NAD(P)H-binding protein [Chthonomonadaceae bacterium]